MEFSNHIFYFLLSSQSFRLVSAVKCLLELKLFTKHYTYNITHPTLHIQYYISNITHPTLHIQNDVRQHCTLGQLAAGGRNWRLGLCRRGLSLVTQVLVFTPIWGKLRISEGWKLAIMLPIIKKKVFSTIWTIENWDFVNVIWLQFIQVLNELPWSMDSTTSNWQSCYRMEVWIYWIDTLHWIKPARRFMDGVCKC